MKNWSSLFSVHSARLNLLLVLLLGVCSGMETLLQGLPAQSQSGIPQAYQQIPATSTVPAYQAGASQNALGAQQAAGPESILIILDASESMGIRLGNQTKMDGAKQVILDVLKKVPPNVPVGLRVYGHLGRGYGDPCRATQTLVPIGTGNRMSIASQLVGIKPTGTTPISYALTRALQEDFRNVGGPHTVILVSDGEETCAKDPCDLAVEMMRSNANIKIHTVAYGLADYGAQRQLKCVALATKGKFMAANTSAQLSESLNELFNTRKNVQAEVLTPH
ncbi:MAG: VWA domain-containing protein [Candidatus Melainabacteria bacterium]